MNLDDEKSIETITKFSLEMQNQNLRLFARVDLQTKLQILQIQKQLFHKLKSEYSDVDKAILTLSSLILAVDEVTKKLDSEDLNTAKFKASQRRARSKRDKILAYWAIVKWLKNEQLMSFRDITSYLLKYHKLSVAHSTIATLWNELEQQNLPTNKG